MQTLKAQQKVDSIIQDVTKNGIIAENMIKELKDLREIVRVEQDPLVIKTLRLVYTYIEDEGSFDLNLLEEEEIDEIEEEEDGIDAEAKEEEEEEEEEIYEFSTVEDFEEKRENFLYFLSLIKESENEYNRKELKKLRSFLWEEIHG
jgi:CO dehydrogenase/acetyl-CoA synthase beta subunit